MSEPNVSGHAPELVRARSRAACAHLCAPGQIRRYDDMVRRAQLMYAVIRSRAAFERLHARERTLREALLRFRERRAALG